MGCFGYICVKCGLSIRAGEKAVLRHIRHGEVLGEAAGTCDDYGRVYEDTNYRNYDIGNTNSHDQICQSEFGFTDSIYYDGKIYKGNPIKWMEYRKVKVAEGLEDLCAEIYKEWETLEKVSPREIRSGTQAYHQYCWDRASEEEKAKHIISKGDPNQAGGQPRKKYL